MIRASLDSRVLPLFARVIRAFRVDDWTPKHIDPDVVRYVAGVSVWGRWFVVVVTVFQFAYRPGFWYYGHFEYTLLLVPLIALNGLVHYRLLAKGWVPWQWLLLLSAMDIALATVGVIIQGGFPGFLFVAYYPALALFIVVFTSLGLGLAWTTLTAGIYALVCVTVDPRLDLVAGQEKELLVRVGAMYALVLCVGLVARFERTTRQAAVARERALQREQMAFSQAVHDTTAQSAFMIRLGLDTAKAQAAEGSPRLSATLDEMSRLSVSTVWELRHPISMGGIYEGRALGWALRAHAASFTNVTNVPAEFTQTGVESPLSVEVRGRLFAIAHNALTNAFRHAQATHVAVRLDFGEDTIRLSVSDDGLGLPDDYAQRGQGFANMRRDAERLGGRLEEKTRGSIGGTTVTCVIPTVRS